MDTNRIQRELADAQRTFSSVQLYPTNDGKVIRLPLPALTEERRKDLVKHLHKVLENHRTAMRNVRRDIKEAIEHLEKDKKVSEDEREKELMQGVFLQSLGAQDGPR